MVRKDQVKFWAGFVWGINLVLTILFRRPIVALIRNIANWIGDFIYGILISFLPESKEEKDDGESKV